MQSCFTLHVFHKLFYSLKEKTEKDKTNREDFRDKHARKEEKREEGDRDKERDKRREKKEEKMSAKEDRHYRVSSFRWRLGLRICRVFCLGGALHTNGESERRFRLFEREGTDR